MILLEFGVGEWALDDFMVTGQALHVVHIEDTLIEEPDSNFWMSWPGGSPKSAIANGRFNSGQGLWFSDPEGERSITTKDLVLPLATYLYFQIIVGAEEGEEDGEEQDPVALEMSVDGGRAWTPVRPSCSQTEIAGASGSGSTRCFRFEPSLYYPSHQKEWRHVLIPLDDVGLCGPVRLRWRQGFYRAQNHPPSFGLRKVSLGPLDPTCGPRCPHGMSHCPHFGLCIPLDDQGRPSTINEDFESLPLRQDLWSRWSGAHLSRTGCGQLASGSAMVFRLPTERTLVTTDVDTTKTSFLQFHLRLGCNPVSLGSVSVKQPVWLLFSTDGGATWTLLEEFHLQSLESATFLTLELPQEARKNATQFKWWQPVRDNYYTMDWALDRVRLGRGHYERYVDRDEQVQSDSDVGLIQPEEEPEETGEEPIYLSSSIGGTPSSSVCGSPNTFLHFSGVPGDELLATTTDVQVLENMFIQFEFVMSCTKSASCYTVIMEKSTDKGQMWTVAQEPCLPSMPWCRDAHSRGSVFVSDLHRGIHTVTQDLPGISPTSSSLVRFRWRSVESSRSGIPVSTSSGQQKWSLGKISFGSSQSCPNMCSGRGQCRASVCTCESGWTGSGCQARQGKDLPVVLEDHFGSTGNSRSFPEGGSSSRWLQSSGGIVSDICGPMPSGTAMHFYGECSRVLETIDLDLSGGSRIQFWFRVGCLSPDRGPGLRRLPAEVHYDDPQTAQASRNRAVLLQYSLDSGVHWTTFMELRSDRLHRTNEAKLRSTAIPPGAKTSGVRLRWWQPAHGGRARDDWAIDAVRVGPTQISPEAYYGYEGNELDPINSTRGNDFIDLHLKMSSDGPSRASTPFTKENEHWLRQDNVQEGLCGDKPSLVGKATNNEEAIVETFDVSVKTDFVLQFQLWVGCNRSSQLLSVPPLSLEVSTDKGQTWQLLVALCQPKMRGCDGRVSTPSQFYPQSTRKWKRFVFPLGQANAEDKDYTQIARFRWRQPPSDSALPWSVRDLYIGPSCPDHCQGNGRCTAAGCVCTDEDCRPVSEPLQKSLRSKFLPGFPTTDSDVWHTVLGSSVAVKDHLEEVRFETPGLRLIESEDLDLRGAKFIQFTIRIDRTTEIVETNTIYLQFSTNKGISWYTLSSYRPGVTTIKEEYLELPREALVEQVRFRWWQLASPVDDRMIFLEQETPWSLSRVLIGGDSINPAAVLQDFETSNNLEENFWFWPGLKIRDDFCNLGKSCLAWHPSTTVDGASNYLLTRQLIVDTDFILQFKIVVNCGAVDQCPTRGKVNLLYTTDFSKGSWSNVEEPCLPSTLSGEYLNYNSVGKNRKVNVFCSPFRIHTGTTYTSDGYSEWTRVTLLLPERTFSGQTQFRWISDTRDLSWGISYLYVGEACPGLCSGRGDCHEGRCICDHGRTGPDCRMKLGPYLDLSPPLEDLFENGHSPGPLWDRIRGGRIVATALSGVACGPLLTSSGRGGRIYFDGCGTREAVTKELDTTQAGKVSYILRIGSREGRPDCHVLGLSNASWTLQDKSVLLQYTTDEGIRWLTLSSHPPEAFLQAQTVQIELPVESRGQGVRLRWWQPRHEGKGHDQWAIDEVKISISGNAHLDLWRHYGSRYQG